MASLSKLQALRYVQPRLSRPLDFDVTIVVAVRLVLGVTGVEAKVPGARDVEVTDPARVLCTELVGIGLV